METAETRTEGGAIGREALDRLFLQARTHRARLDRPISGDDLRRIVAARDLGLDNAKIDASFFKDAAWRSNFVCSVGHGVPSRLHPRDPRLDFPEACRIA